MSPVLADEALGGDKEITTGGGGRLFCIFCIKERLSASKRLRYMDECVLYFKHYIIEEKRVSKRNW